ncbi:MAG TPA: apolipoprotein N-acyltransferase [Nitrospirota bacterium]|nr:apolipoprotein N-acyltransferase [Nitrospirota bacterium]
MKNVDVVSKNPRLMHALLPWIAAVTGGVLAFLGYAGFDHFYLEWICLVPILWAISGQTPGRAFLIGWVAGIVGHGGGFYWIVTMLRQFADASWPLAVMVLLLLAAANGVVFAIWAWATRLICGGAGWSAAWVSPVVWTATEKFWPQLFPNYFGASQYKLSLVTQIADFAGILGVTFLVVYTNSTIYAVIERIRRKHPYPWMPAVIFSVVIGMVLVYGAVRISIVDRNASSAASLAVGLVQTNRGAGEKHFDEGLFLREHQEMSRELVKSQPLDIIVWPESVLFLNLASREEVLPTSLLGDLRTPLLFGAVILTEGRGERRMYNSAVLVDGTGRIIGTYDKMVLVPFGEYIPFGDTFPRLYSWSPYSGRFWKGKNTEPLQFNGHVLSVNICYEDIFPEHIRMLMQGGRYHRIPEAMFNLTNDSWYGNTVQPMEHLVLASFRSIEHRRALVRSTNTGISAIVDPVGRIDRRTGQWTKASLVGRIPLMQGRTVYAVLGDWIGWVSVIIALLGVSRAFQTTRRLANRSAAHSAGKRDRIGKHATSGRTKDKR